MRKISIFLAGTMFLGIILSVSAFKPLAKGSSANGQGAVIPDGSTDEQQFSFHANTDKNGNVSGSWVSHSPGQNVDTRGNITCLTVLPDGKTAWLSGVVTKVNDDNPFGVVVGDPIRFTVVDNGEGANAGGDQFTDYYFGSGNSCADLGVPLKTILNGNIQVKP
jgi:hypothetical protein